MAKPTLKELACAGLTARGYKRDLRSRSRKYVVFAGKLAGTKIYVGAAGAVRVGRAVAMTRPMTDAAKKALLEDGRRFLESQKGTQS